jgi:Icc-related predicted phosphoesterase
MEIIATSDLHGGITPYDKIEKFAKKANKFPLAIIAGDIGVGVNFHKVLGYFKTKTLVVPGNHDLYVDHYSMESEYVYERGLKETCKKLNIHYLDSKPYIINDKVAVVGVMGWYDYSFKDLSVPATDYDYQRKRYGFTIWNDVNYVKWDYNDDSFTKYQLRKLKKFLEKVKHIETVIVVMHFVGYKEQLDCANYYKNLAETTGKLHLEDIRRTSNTGWRFGNAFQGSDKFGKLIDKYENVKYVISGHQHKSKKLIHNGKNLYTIGTDYGKIKHEVINV